MEPRDRSPSVIAAAAASSQNLGGPLPTSLMSLPCKGRDQRLVRGTSSPSSRLIDQSRSARITPEAFYRIPSLERASISPAAAGICHNRTFKRFSVVFARIFGVLTFNSRSTLPMDQVKASFGGLV